MHQCSVGCLTRQLKLLPAARLRGAVALALCSRQAAGSLLTVLSVLGSESEAPEGCVCVLLQLLQLTLYLQLLSD